MAIVLYANFTAKNGDNWRLEVIDNNLQDANPKEIFLVKNGLKIVSEKGDLVDTIYKQFAEFTVKDNIYNLLPLFIGNDLKRYSVSIKRGGNEVFRGFILPDSVSAGLTREKQSIIVLCSAGLSILERFYIPESVLQPAFTSIDTLIFEALKYLGLPDYGIKFYTNYEYKDKAGLTCNPLKMCLDNEFIYSENESKSALTIIDSLARLFCADCYIDFESKHLVIKTIDTRICDLWTIDNTGKATFQIAAIPSENWDNKFIYKGGNISFEPSPQFMDITLTENFRKQFFKRKGQLREIGVNMDNQAFFDSLRFVDYRYLNKLIPFTDDYFLIEDSDYFANIYNTIVKSYGLYIPIVLNDRKELANDISIKANLWFYSMAFVSNPEPAETYLIVSPYLFVPDFMGISKRYLSREYVAGSILYTMYKTNTASLDSVPTTKEDEYKRLDFRSQVPFNYKKYGFWPYTTQPVPQRFDAAYSQDFISIKDKKSATQEHTYEGIKFELNLRPYIDAYIRENEDKFSENTRYSLPLVIAFGSPIIMFMQDLSGDRRYTYNFAWKFALNSEELTISDSIDKTETTYTFENANVNTGRESGAIQFDIFDFEDETFTNILRYKDSKGLNQQANLWKKNDLPGSLVALCANDIFAMKKKGNKSYSIKSLMNDSNLFKIIIVESESYKILSSIYNPYTNNTELTIVSYEI